MPSVVAAAMNGTLFPAPDPEDLDVPSQLAVRDRNHDRRIRRASYPEGGWRACRADVPRSNYSRKFIDTFPQRSQGHD
jgi:hypothetical protein